VADLVVLVLVGLGTYALRASFLVPARADPPAPLARLLPHVGPAVLAAITAPAVLVPHGTVSTAGAVQGVLAAAVTAALWRKTRSLPLALFGGLATAWLGARLLG
jgi:branched-subunit amino acid transport protein